MMKYWIYKEGDVLKLDIQGTGERGLSRSVDLTLSSMDEANIRGAWAQELQAFGYKDADRPNADRWAVVSEYSNSGLVSAVIIDSHEFGTNVPLPGEYPGFDRYVDRFDTLEAAEAAKKEALEA